MRRFIHYNRSNHNLSIKSPAKCCIDELSDYARTNARWFMKTRQYLDLQQYDRQIYKTQNRLLYSALGLVSPIIFVLPVAFYPGLEMLFHVNMETYLAANVGLFCGSTLFCGYNSVRLIQLERKAMDKYKEISKNLVQKWPEF